MKGKRVHRVPLSERALAILRDLHETRPEDSKAIDLVFPSQKKAPLSDMSLTAVLRRMNTVGEGETPPWRDGATGEPIVPHGFRSTFRDWAGEATAHPRELVEAALAHAVRDKAEAAYARSDLLDRRRALMDEWGRVCEG